MSDSYKKNTHTKAKEQEGHTRESRRATEKLKRFPK